jgi:flavine halogenase
MAAYKQIHNLDAAILSDVDEDNFDKAFDLFRPVIQGSADFGRALTQGELNEA